MFIDGQREPFAISICKGAVEIVSLWARDAWRETARCEPSARDWDEARNLGYDKASLCGKI